MKLENNVLTINGIEYPTLAAFMEAYTVNIADIKNELFTIIQDYVMTNKKNRHFEEMEHFPLLRWDDFSELPDSELKSCIDGFLTQTVIAHHTIKQLLSLEAQMGKEAIEQMKVDMQLTSLAYIHDNKSDIQLNINLE